MARSFQRSPLALAILALLYEAPMHPYEMQRLIKERGKDEVINVRQRASLYQTIERLSRAGLIRVLETTRAENRPERTVYALTATGRETTLRWIREMIATPERDFPDFPAALAQLALLTPDDTRQQLSLRAEALRREQQRIEDLLRRAATFLPRLFALETEYQSRVLEAELAWVHSLVADLADGTLTWDEAEIRKLAAELSPVKGGD
ncbi:MAG TPA: PadR family transcriptional regulator [Thermomicrobiales bacterium]|jgi:DNA-binding PadR family transcriptional regulator